MGEADEETVGQRIQRLREEKGLTQRDLAVDGVNHGTISKIERGVRTATRKTLTKIAKPLGVTPDYLEYGVDPMQLLRDALCKVHHVHVFADEAKVWLAHAITALDNHRRAKDGDEREGPAGDDVDDGGGEAPRGE